MKIKSGFSDFGNIFGFYFGDSVGVIFYKDTGAIRLFLKYIDVNGNESATHDYCCCCLIFAKRMKYNYEN